MTSMWYQRTGGSRGAWTATARMSEEHGDGEIVESTTSAAPVLWTTSESGSGVLHIDIPSVDGPPLWFVHIDEPRSTPRATNIVAFTAEVLPPGTVVDQYGYATLGVPSDQQVGALRWHPENGLVHQIFVAPDWRRHRVGSMLLYAADAFHHFRGWPGRLHGDGNRTELGEQFLAAQRHPERIAPRTRVMPPMDPPR
jgi:GNAT superfamily N-acetyltransferase